MFASSFFFCLCAGGGRCISAHLWSTGGNAWVASVEQLFQLTQKLLGKRCSRLGPFVRYSSYSWFCSRYVSCRLCAWLRFLFLRLFSLLHNFFVFHLLCLAQIFLSASF